MDSGRGIQAIWFLAAPVHVNGNLAEGQGSNIFLVRDGLLLTPRERYVLPGVSRQAGSDSVAALLGRQADHTAGTIKFLYAKKTAPQGAGA